MSVGNKLIQKVGRRAKNVKKNVDSDWKRYDKVDKSDDLVAGSPGVYKLMRGQSRRLDSKLGIDTVKGGAKAMVALSMTATTLERFDYGGGSYGIRATLPAPIMAFAGMRPGDIVEVKEGALAGRNLKVVAVTDSTHIRLEDVPSFVGALGAHETTQIVAVADVAGSLNDTYFLVNSAADATEYYVWYNVAAGGTDPALAGKTGIMVAIATGATAAQVGAATRAAIATAASADFAVTGATTTAILTCTASGVTTDASDAGSTGFAISTTLQGTDDDPTGSESDVVLRLEASSVKKSYS